MSIAPYMGGRSKTLLRLSNNAISAYHDGSTARNTVELLPDCSLDHGVWHSHAHHGEVIVLPSNSQAQSPAT
eukprot:1837793-Amphidinium_carterae.1